MEEGKNVPFRKRFVTVTDINDCKIDLRVEHVISVEETDNEDEYLIRALDGTKINLNKKETRKLKIALGIIEE